MTEEYSYALTWEAATERLEAAGCITVKEAEAMEEHHSSDEAGIDVSNPTLLVSIVRYGCDLSASNLLLR